MLKNRSALVISAFVVLSLGYTQRIWSGDPAEFARERAALRAQIADLRQQRDALVAAQGPRAGGAVTPAETIIADIGRALIRIDRLNDHYQETGPIRAEITAMAGTVEALNARVAAITEHPVTRAQVPAALAAVLWHNLNTLSGTGSLTLAYMALAEPLIDKLPWFSAATKDAIASTGRGALLATCANAINRSLGLVNCLRVHNGWKLAGSYVGVSLVRRLLKACFTKKGKPATTTTTADDETTADSVAQQPLDQQQSSNSVGSYFKGSLRWSVETVIAMLIARRL